MASIAKRVWHSLAIALFTLACGSGGESNVRHSGQALCTGACSDGLTRFLFAYAGSGTGGPSVAITPLASAQFRRPGGLLFTSTPYGFVPANSLFISDTDNNSLRFATGSTIQAITIGAPNLVTNPGCDAPLVAGVIPGWAVPSNSPNPTLPYHCYTTTDLQVIPPHQTIGFDPFDGNQYFGCDHGNWLEQFVDVSAYAPDIDGGGQGFIFNAYVRLPPVGGGSANIELQDLDANRATLGPTIVASSMPKGWTRVTKRHIATINTRFIKIRLRPTNAGSSVLGFDAVSLVADGLSTFNKPQGWGRKDQTTLLVADSYNDRIQTLSFSSSGFNGIVSSGYDYPTAVTGDPVTGAVFIADFNHHQIKRWSGVANDPPTVFAGTGTVGSSGDGGLATAAQLNYPSGVATDFSGGVIIADRSNAVIRKVTNATIQTVAGVSGVLGNDGDGGPATAAHFIRPWSVAFGGDLAIYVVDIGAHNIRKIKNGIITTVAGSGSPGALGDGASALLAQLNQPSAFALDGASSSVFIADAQNQRIRVATCGDRNACNGTESYDVTSGSCAAGTIPNVNDSNACTTDSCDPIAGPVHSPVSSGTSCADTNLCNGSETCNGSGVCIAGVPKTTDDGKFCTTDSCASSTGIVTHTPTPGVVCSPGTCVSGTQTMPGQCTASGDCGAGATILCGNYLCGTSSCLGSCTADAQCIPRAFCDTQTGSATLNNCLPEVGPSQTCLRDRQCLAGACVDGGCCDATATADPLASVAITPLRPTDFVSQISAIYSGSSATQTALPNTVDANHVAVIRGKVLTEGGAALPCAKISVVGAPNLGSTRSRGDGAFTIAVNGGGPVTLRFELATYLTVDRKVDTSWHAFSIAQDVRMLTFGNATTVSSTASGITTVSGAAETDGALGTRTARLLFPPSTRATVAGETSPRASVSVQVKELTNFSKVKRDGMPASLPVASAFTYAVNLSVAGAENKTVTLTNGSGQPQAVPFYVENFLGMPIGEVVPVGYYDTGAAQWVASNNGLVIKIISKDAAGAHLDVDSVTGVNPDVDALALGITDAERQSLAGLYAVGTSLWRFTTTHFSSWDANWGWGPPSPPPQNPSPSPHLPQCGGSSAGGSIIDCEKQGLREKLPLAGTPFELFYASNRQPGGNKPLSIPLTAATLPPALKGVQLEVYVAGRKIVPPGFPLTTPTAGTSFDFYWDGLDAAGRTLYGAQPITTRIGFTFDGSYMRTSRFGAPGGSVVVAPANGRFDPTLWQEWSGVMDRWDAQQTGLGGWDIDVHHGYDPSSGTLHLGDGRDELVPATLNEFQTVALGNGLAPFGTPGKIAVATDGAIYYVDTQMDVVNKIASDGSISRIAGGGSATAPSFGDGGPALSATFASLAGLALGPNKELYLADKSHHRVRVVDLATGLVTNFAGNGSQTPGTNGIATVVGLNFPVAVAAADDGSVVVNEDAGRRVLRIQDGQLTAIVPNSPDLGSGVAVAKDGTVYFSVSGGSDSVWKVDRAGTTTAITKQHNVGSTPCTNAPGEEGEGGPAISACVGIPDALAVGPDGLLYIADTNKNTVRRITATGNIETVLGTGQSGVNGPDGLAGPRTAIARLNGIAFGPDGTLYAADNSSDGGTPKIRASVRSIGRQFPAIVPSSDGRELHVFDANGHHAKTLDAHTGILKYAFRYDTAGYLTGISDRDLWDATGHVTTIERDSAEVPLSITAPFGQTTTLSVVATQLKTVTDPELGLYKFDYFPGGLLQHYSDPPTNRASGPTYSFAFTNELLTTDTDPLGNSQSLSSSPLTNGWRVTRKDQLLRATTYDTQSLDPLAMLSTVTGPDSLATTTSVFLDGRKTDLAPDGTLFSGHQRNPDGSTAYSLSDSDPTLGMRAPVASSSIEFMGLSTDPHKTTARSRSTTLNNAADISSIKSFTEAQTVNGRAQPDKVSYDALTGKFTTTSSAGRTTVRLVDTHGRTTSFKVGTLAPTTFLYDDTATATGKVSSEDRNDGTIDLKKAYTYYGTGNGKMSGYLSGVSYALNNTVRQSSSYSADAFGRTILDTTGADVTNFFWDGNGNLDSVTPPGRNEHDQTYSLLDQLLSYKPPALPPTTPATPVNTNYTYTADRKLQTVTTADSAVTTRVYDTTNGRLTDITTPAGTSHYDYFAATETAAGQAPGQIKAISSPYGANLAFTYIGRLMASARWSGNVNGSVAWVYDNDFARISETITDSAGTSAAVRFGYADLDKFLTCASLTTDCSTPSSNALSVTHDPVNGLLSDVTFGSLKETYGYDNFGQLASKTANFGTTPVFQNIYDPATGTTNRRDALGRVTHREEFIGTTPVTKFDYTYSNEGRLTDVLVNGAPSEHYDYGTLNGNRTAGNTPQRNVTATQVVYDSQDRLRTYGQYTYTYTNNGELKTKTDSSSSIVTTYAYDTLGNLISVTQPTRFIGYIVDGMNRRVAKKVGTTAVNATISRQWLYRDGLKPVAELDGTGHLVSTFVYGSSANVPDYMFRGTKTYRILTDQVGSVRRVVDVMDATNVPFSATYTAFGEGSITAAIPDFLPFGFGGGMFDVDTGLVRFGVRDYDPIVGRWTAKDPIRFAGRQANLYVYVANDPVNQRDPAGLYSVCEWLSGAAADGTCGYVCAKLTDGAATAVCWLGCAAVGDFAQDAFCPPKPRESGPTCGAEGSGNGGSNGGGGGVSGGE